MESHFLLKGAPGSNAVIASRLASGGVHLNWRELLFGEAIKLTSHFPSQGHAMSVKSVTSRCEVCDYSR